ncbi:annexin A6-like protein [Cinnamomum micranthum f. kanehirae]|uniref:Annexin n=1 Tax=Cinnamomum micranthum f. kanehirae TaxID=337451 RepID=A0A3S4NE55_9MAGN|nr:annexin A6-like protein [Cinnamomum micranthum f. kanehirae]
MDLKDMQLDGRVGSLEVIELGREKEEEERRRWLASKFLTQFHLQLKMLRVSGRPLKKAMYRWIYGPAEREAILVYTEVRNANPTPNPRAIIEIACVSSPAELLEVKKAYQLRYKHSIEEDVALLVALVGTYRYYGGEIDTRLAHAEAKALHHAIEERAFGHEEIIRILTTRSKAQLNATFNCYKDEYGTTVNKSLSADSKNELFLALRATIRCLTSPCKYFEKLLRNAIINQGTDEGTLTRVIVSRAEKDLQEIKEVYFKRNNVPLTHADGEQIRKAIISILGHRNADQRAKIFQAYEELYEESLANRLQSKISGDFGRALILWMLDPAERDAKLAKETLRKKGVRSLQVIIEISCASSPCHLLAVRKAYCSLFKCSLEEDIALYIAKPLRKLLLSMVSSFRYDGEDVDEKIAKSEADQLHDAIERQQLDQDHIIWILSTRNQCQLKATFNIYKQDYGNPIDEDIRDRSNNNFATLLQATVWCIESPEKHFSEVVRSSVVRLGTDEDSLTRAIITRAEIDMEKIKKDYYEVNKISLLDAVVDDTSGDYKDFLVALLGCGNL